MASSSFWADRFPMRSSSATLPASREVQIPRRFHQTRVHQVLHHRDAQPVDVHGVPAGKWARLRSNWAGHSAPVQRMWAPSSSRSTGAPHTGQVWGKR